MNVWITKTGPGDFGMVGRLAFDLEMPDADRHVFNQCVMASFPLFVGEVDGEIACVWGLISPTILSDTAYIWLYTTELIEDHKFMFIRRSMLEVEKLRKEYSVIAGHVAIGNDSAQKWLTILGAKMKDKENGLIRFTMGNTDG